MSDDQYKTLRVAVRAGIARITLDHGDINLFDRHMFAELAGLAGELNLPRS